MRIFRLQLPMVLKRLSKIRDPRKKQIIHMVICNETWEEVAKDSAEIMPKKSRHVWISDQPFSKEKVHKRCNLCARHRWGIESGILVEKRHGYGYEHAFSYNWNVMKGYHYLMRLAHFINILALPFFSPFCNGFCQHCAYRRQFPEFREVLFRSMGCNCVRPWDNSGAFKGDCQQDDQSRVKSKQ